jgi:hypothetical protein
VAFLGWSFLVANNPRCDASVCLYVILSVRSFDCTHYTHGCESFILRIMGQRLSRDFAGFFYWPQDAFFGMHGINAVPMFVLPLSC